MNLVRPRMPRLLDWLDQRQPDVVCLQETKTTEAAFGDLVAGPLAERGYAFASHGQGQWNGVALLSRTGLEDIERGFAGQPGFPDAATQEARAISAVCGGVRIYSLYVPNGREPDSDHYHYKLAWLDALRHAATPGPDGLALCGDINIAPTDADVFNPAAYVGQTHVTPPERQALTALEEDLGLVDVVRDRWPEEQVYSYWDYRAGMFHKNLGMRIDLVLASAPVASRVKAAWVDRAARKGKQPSDHAPVIIDLDSARDGDIGPMVPPPSARAGSASGVRLPQAR